MRWFLCFFILLQSLAYADDKLKIGSFSFYPPFEMQTDTQGQLTGFDIELMNAICKEMGKSCESVPMVFKEIIPALLNGEIDLAISAINITDDRREIMLFSLPYLNSYLQFMTVTDSKFNTVADIKGAKIGIVSGTISKEYIITKLKQPYVLKEYNTLDDLLSALSNKDIDVILLDSYSGDYWVAASADKFKLVGERLPFGSGYGIAAQLNKTELISEINKALNTLESNGVYLKIYKNYF